MRADELSLGFYFSKLLLTGNAHKLHFILGSICVGSVCDCVCVCVCMLTFINCRGHVRKIFTFLC